MKLITRGVTRLVFLVGPYAIKIPKPRIWNHFLRGLLANIDENIVWKYSLIPGSFLADANEYLCPVVWCSWGGWIMIMKRVEPVDPETWEPIPRLLSLCGDHKPSNYGMLGDRMVMVDYPSYSPQR